MRAFSCAVCGQLLFFENSKCLRCGTRLGVDPATLALDVVAPGRRACANAVVAACNWLVADDDPSALCRSCRLTRTRPNDADLESMERFRSAEIAKRRLLHQVWSLGLPVVSRTDDPRTGLAFDLLSSRGAEVTTGHEDGLITLDLSESDAVHREFVRLQLGEPYRTVLGHLRHEIGHYFWPILVERAGNLDDFRALFGDERLSYDAALERHYSTGPSADWPNRFVSAYATMHPWEDWAETFAHYLHIQAGTETADSFGLRVGDPSRRAARRSIGAAEDSSETGGLLEHWLSLTYALNSMAHSLGQDALYPFVLAPAVMAKLDFVHRCIGDVVPGDGAPTHGRLTDGQLADGHFTGGHSGGNVHAGQ